MNYVPTGNPRTRGAAAGRALGLLALVTALLVLGLWLWGRYVFTPEWVDSNVFAPLEQRWQRDLSVEKVALRSDGLLLGGLVIGEHADFADSEGDVFAYSSQVELRIDWAELLDGKLHVSRVDLREPTVYLRRAADGRLNASSLVAMLTDGTQPGDDNDDPEDAEPLKITLNMKHGVVEYGDLLAQDIEAQLRISGDRVKLTELSLETADGTLTASGEADLGDSPPSLGVGVWAEEIDLKILAEALDLPIRLRGELSLEANFAMADPRSSKQRQVEGKEAHWAELLQGRGRFNIDKGRVEGSELLNTIASLTGLGGLTSLPLNKSGGELIVTSGSVSSERIVLGGESERVLLMGAVDLAGDWDVEAWAGANDEDDKLDLPSWVRPLMRCEIEQIEDDSDPAGSRTLRWKYVPFAMTGSVSEPRVAFPRRAFTPTALLATLLSDGSCDQPPGSKSGASGINDIGNDAARALRNGIDSILGDGADCVPIPFIRDCPAG